MNRFAQTGSRYFCEPVRQNSRGIRSERGTSEPTPKDLFRKKLN